MKTLHYMFMEAIETASEEEDFSLERSADLLVDVVATFLEQDELRRYVYGALSSTADPKPMLHAIQDVIVEMARDK